ncbi:phytanoyl-CoA dioxygenase family protein [Streptomyces daliensis]|uniref:Phytanoyl-CoA dioxygenase family protein n=1 Tax=Streptomyces daliensis TaxID=299421 RepID=A0A8T4IXC0_9ACTN|nr:phytanoyl-CoA dioxygenase family protein [Streptomyces daliensis]
MAESDASSRFRRDGYLQVPGRIPEHELTALRAEADRLINLAVNVQMATGRPGGRLEAVWRDDRLFARMMQPVIDLSPPFLHSTSDARVLAPLRRLMGDEPRFAHDKLLYKQLLPGGEDIRTAMFPRDYDEGFVMHTDAGWYTAEDNYPPTAVTCAVFLDDSSGRGALSVLPGSHAQSFPCVRGGDIEEGCIDPRDLVEINGAAGDLLFFHSRLVHASGKNDSGLPRRIFMATYCPARDFTGDPDRRSRRKREPAQHVEAEYRELVASGSYTDAEHLISSQ